MAPECQSFLDNVNGEPWLREARLIGVIDGAVTREAGSTHPKESRRTEGASGLEKVATSLARAFPY
jgi:hypothetical protein